MTEPGIHGVVGADTHAAAEGEEDARVGEISCWAAADAALPTEVGTASALGKGETGSGKCGDYSRSGLIAVLQRCFHSSWLPY